MERRRPVVPQAPRRNAQRGIVLRRPSPQRRGLPRGKKEPRDSGKNVDCSQAAADSLASDENAVQQQAVLESLASYLEGELMVRLQSYTELLAEVESLNKERLFYHGKLSRMEKVCERAQPYASSVPMVDCIQTILAATTDRPDA